MSDRKSRYLDAALKLFIRHGYVGTTTDMLIAEVGGSKATLYKYFPRKEDLVAGIMERLAAAMAPADAIPADTPIDEALHQIGTIAVRGILSDRAVGILRLALGERDRFPELCDLLWKHGPAVTYGRFHRFLDERIAAGELEVEDKQLAAEQFIAALVGHIQLKYAMGQMPALSDDEIDRRVASATRTFLARYRAP